jgi:hypothetical protein
LSTTPADEHAQDVAAVSRAKYQRAWRAARKLARGAEPCTWVRLRPAEVEQLRALGSDRAIARTAGLSHHTVGRALAGGQVYWSSAARLRALVL